MLRTRSITPGTIGSNRPRRILQVEDFPGHLHGARPTARPGVRLLLLLLLLGARDISIGDQRDRKQCAACRSGNDVTT